MMSFRRFREIYGTDNEAIDWDEYEEYVAEKEAEQEDYSRGYNAREDEDDE